MATDAETDVNHATTMTIISDTEQAMLHQDIQKFSADVLCKAAAEGNVVRVEELLQEEYDPALPDECGITPLMHASQQGHDAVLRLLLDAGAPWNALDPSGRCAGDYAMDAGHQAAFDMLLNAGIQSELILGVVERQSRLSGVPSNHSYLESNVRYSSEKLLDDEDKGVMMAWEKPIMEAHAKAICMSGGDILNVGFGMGLVDEAIQSYSPRSHTIIEAHPQVYASMLERCWNTKANVHILFGRWQDVLPQLHQYDGIFFDTYGEFYDDLRDFHTHLPKLLKPDGLYSYFNGLCANNAFFHVTYCQLVALELGALGYSTQFIPLPVKECLNESTWVGVKKYWQLDTYFLPVCQADLEDET